ncbi:hypothetical protein [uncultured Lacinutrix sp.]|uniref:hypothetical protein n=1 Tax=uncultured Lacinutrix sp. TaxID=574032 RepID=UPI002605C5F0|nr:hypothetical protein [uncultured Lacinutrix sp.]
MKQQFGNFEFDKEKSATILNYNRSSKDWFDISTSMLLGLSSLVFSIWMAINVIDDFS